jgi:hypothetical protein
MTRRRTTPLRFAAWTSERHEVRKDKQRGPPADASSESRTLGWLRIIFAISDRWMNIFNKRLCVRISNGK